MIIFLNPYLRKMTAEALMQNSSIFSPFNYIGPQSFTNSPDTEKAPKPKQI
jgi:hypothetical protein